MAIERIYDQTVGQLAGFRVVAAGKGQIANDGTQAFVQAVTVVDNSGAEVGLATEATLLDVLTTLQTPAATLPVPGIVGAGDTTFARNQINISTATTTQIVAAVSGQTTRAYVVALTVDGAQVLTLNAANAAPTTFEFQSSGGSLVLDLMGYAWFETAANEAFSITTSTTAQVRGLILTQTGA